MYKLIGILLCIFFGNCKDYQPVTTFFKRIDENNNVVDRQDKKYDAELGKPFITKIQRSDIQATIKVNPEIVDNGGVVTVTWYAVENPNEKDFIAFYCPADDKPTNFIDFVYVKSSSTWKQGLGEIMLTVYNMRTECVFKYFRNNEHSQLVAISNQLSFIGGPLNPLQGRISMTNNPTEMRVMWVSAEAIDLVLVEYDERESLGQTEKQSSVRTYSASNMCQPPANDSRNFVHPGHIYDVLLTKLKPNTKYFYRYGSPGHMSRVAHFTTAIPAGDPTPYTGIFYGDMGVSAYPHGQTTAKLVHEEVLRNDIRFVYHNGDISYARGYAYIWEQWSALIEPYATLVPYMIGIGNHEYDHTAGGEKDPSGAPGQGFRPTWFNGGTDSGGECGVPMFNRFKMPDNGHALWWYSYDYGLAHYVMLSSEHDYSPGSPQYEWLENDLKSLDREKTPWVVLGAHRAMYCSAMIPGDYIVAVNMQRLFEDLLYKYKVDLALWAHYHSYERMCKMYKNECRDDGVTHLVIGSAGRSTDADVWYDKPWSIYHINDYGYGRLHVVNRTHIHWEWVQNSSQKVLDHVWLTK